MVDFPGSDEFIEYTTVSLWLQLHNNVMQVVLSNGDMVIATGANPSGEGDHYECVASFEQRNVTVARYRMIDLHGHSGIL